MGMGGKDSFSSSGTVDVREELAGSRTTQKQRQPELVSELSNTRTSSLSTLAHRIRNPNGVESPQLVNHNHDTQSVR